MTRHTPDTLAGALLLLVCGTGLFVISRLWGVDGSLVRQMAAFAGPLGLMLGIGMAIHGRSMPTTQISVPARAWGVLGSVASILNLWTLGHFEQGARFGRAARLLMPLALVVAWLLPERFYRDASTKEEGPARVSQDGMH